MPQLPSSLTDLLALSADGPHAWLQTMALLVSLLLLEAVLSADNAVALASLVRHVEPAEERQKILNWGLVLALLLRAMAVIGAGFLVQQPLARLLGGAYLVWLAATHFQEELSEEEAPRSVLQSLQHNGLLMVLLVAGTDLAFSLDSVSAAVGITDRLGLVVVAGAAGVVFLRCLAGWMLVWMERFPNLQNAGYLTVLAVGLRLVGQVVIPTMVPSEPVLLLVVLVLFSWGFSQGQAAEP